jgi:hypothetical protein
MKKGLFPENLIVNMFNAKEKLIKEKHIKTFRNENISKYFNNKVELLLGLYEDCIYYRNY